MLSIALLASSALHLATAPAARALSAGLVKDIDSRFLSSGSGPYDFVRVGDRVIFLTSGDFALYSTSGAAGDAVPLGLTELRLWRTPTVALGRAFFALCTFQTGCGLWRTDGTPEGTLRLAPANTFEDRSLAIVTPPGASRAFLAWNDGEHGSELWSTDGTVAGTRRVVDLSSDFLGSHPRDLVWFRNRLWFFADVGSSTRGALFSSDGTQAGTRRVGTTVGGSRLSIVGNRLVFFGRRGSGAPGLFATDGTAAPRPVVAVPSIEGDLGPEITVAGGRGFFLTSPQSGGVELYGTDGTTVGTRRLLTSAFVGPVSMLPLGGKVALALGDETHGVELWASDGTVAGTRQVREICPGPCGGVVRLEKVALGRLFFVGETPARGRELWTSDLTAAGTRLVRDVCRGVCGGEPSGVIESGGRIYFGARSNGFGSVKVFASDGTAAGTRALGALGSGFLRGAPIGAGALVYAGVDASHGDEPWFTDGVASRPIADVESDNVVGSRPGLIGAMDERMVFTASDDRFRDLWVSDGSEGGTVPVVVEDGVDFSEGGDTEVFSVGGRLVVFSRGGTSGPYSACAIGGEPATVRRLLPDGIEADGRFLKAGGQVFFSASDPEHGIELWATDGTPEGTLRLTELPAPEPFRPDFAAPYFFDLRGRLAVPVKTLLGPEEMLLSDGTPAGTGRLSDVYPFLEAPLLAASGALVDRGGNLLFVAGERSGDAKIWRTDLTAPGTLAVGALDPGFPTASEWASFRFGDRMISPGFSGRFGETLFVTDGTPGGTGALGSVPFDLGVAPVVFSGRFWFVGFGALWSTDGTLGGTAAVRDVSGSLVPTRSLAVIGGRLVIVSEAGFVESDGTAEGMHAIELPGGPPDRNAVIARQAGDRLFFSWDDRIHGPEPWAIATE